MAVAAFGAGLGHLSSIGDSMGMRDPRKIEWQVSVPLKVHCSRLCECRQIPASSCLISA